MNPGTYARTQRPGERLQGSPRGPNADGTPQAALRREWAPGAGRGAGGTDLSGDGELQGQVEGGLVVRG